MTPIDYTIVAVYLLLMLGIGRCYAKRNRTADDFLLGGRRMRTVPVALSLFVSWFSVISYTAIPGEMIAHGPWLWMGLAGAPIGLWFVGWVVIPRLRRQRTYARRENERQWPDVPCFGLWQVTSAYELLGHIRCRYLASLLFLSMRLAWMAMIVHIASTVIVAPLLPGIHPTCVASVLVGATVAYSLGGFRAVVLTDVIQAVIMFGGAVIMLGLITRTADFGSLSVTWCVPSFSFDPAVRITFPWAVLSGICLGTCVKAGDQMNVQRFLAVPTVKAARGVLLLGFLFDLCLTTLLCLVGLGLLLYCGDGPIPHADNLMVWFVSQKLPTGVAGLVVAALLAAAMSSLSSGINACVSTVVTDWMPRRLGHGYREPKPCQKTSIMVPGSVSFSITATVGLGIIVLLLSFAIGLVQGNLIELCYKVVNLLATPLGGLVLVALFFPQTRPLAAWIGCIASVAVVVWVNYCSSYTFLVASPFGLTVQLSIAVLWRKRR